MQLCAGAGVSLSRAGRTVKSAVYGLWGTGIPGETHMAAGFANGAERTRLRGFASIGLSGPLFSRAPVVGAFYIVPLPRSEELLAFQPRTMPRKPLPQGTVPPAPRMGAYAGSVH